VARWAAEVPRNGSGTHQGCTHCHSRNNKPFLSTSARTASPPWRKRESFPKDPRPCPFARKEITHDPRRCADVPLYDSVVDSHTYIRTSIFPYPRGRRCSHIEAVDRPIRIVQANCLNKYVTGRSTASTSVCPPLGKKKGPTGESGADEAATRDTEAERGGEREGEKKKGRKEKKRKRADRGIEPRTTRTLSEYHTTRPVGIKTFVLTVADFTTFYVHILIKTIHRYVHTSNTALAIESPLTRPASIRHLHPDANPHIPPQP
jgi:hypothetical protein